MSSELQAAALEQSQTWWVRRSDLNKAEQASNLVHAPHDELVRVQLASNQTTHASGSIAAISHELRTPLSVILGYAELLRGDVDGAQRAQRVETIRRNGYHLLRILDDVLDLARLESGELSVTLAPARLADTVKGVVESMIAAAELKGIAIELEVEPSLEGGFVTDEGRVRQVLANLIGNAIKFNDAGVVRVRAGLQQRADAAWLVASVSDSGPGIARELEARVFEPFQRGTTDKPGTGLGLAISRALAFALGGSLVVHPVERSTFIFEAPVERAEAKLHLSTFSPPVASGADSARALLIEDTPDVQFLVASFLASSGVATSTANNGAEGVRAFKLAVAQGRPFDIVVLDMQMPVMDGYETARTLRALGSTVPILALTANAMIGDRERCLNAGCTSYLAKPVRAAALAREVRALLVAQAHEWGTQESNVPAEAAEAHAPPSEPGALLVSNALEHLPPQLLTSFVERLDERAARMAHAVTHNQAEVLSSLCHQLQGAAASFGFPELADATYALSHAGAQQREHALRNVLSIVARVKRGASGVTSTQEIK
jgi:signal transduction histidine kinase/CheY-like chemotaxis protein/HPt (histidine-containing phosphotransfer) domain-containing protein